MAYIGNIPAESYASFETETFSVSATANYTLSHAVTNENEIRLVINGVVQQPGSGKAYTASGTTLTLTSATASGDSMYAVYLGRALQTVNPPNASVGLSQLSATGTKDATTFLRGDNTFASAGGTMTPAFFATLSSDQSISDTTAVKVQINNEIYDTANAYDNSSNYRFTPQTAGKYIIYSGIMINGDQDNDIEVAELYLNKNSTVTAQATLDSSTNYLREVPLSLTFSVDMNGSSDYVEMYVYANFISGGGTVKGHSSPRARTYFGAYKLIT